MEKLKKVKWKTQQQIEEEKNRPKEPTESEILGRLVTELELTTIEQGQYIADLELRLLELEGKNNV